MIFKFLLFLFQFQLIQSQTIVSFPYCDDAHCKNCYDTDLSKCTTCDSGYTLTSESKCVYTPLLGNCSTYATNGDRGCIKCIDGFYLDITTGLCKEGREYCTSWSRSNGIVCTKCCTNYALTADSQHCI